MLTISKPLSASQVRTYHEREFASERQNYWSRDQQGHSEWQGKLAEQWGLKGAVGNEHFARLTEGQHPHTEEQLVRHQVSKTYEGKFGKEVTSVEHRAGWDATFSAPKSVSLTALVGGDGRVREAHRESVRVALSELERYTQARIGNVHAPETTGKFIAATFEHDTARPVDGYAAPQLHTHAVIFNVTERDNGQTRALQPQELFASQRYATSVYRSELSMRLQGLGYELERGKHGQPEIKGYTREYLEASSPRRSRSKIICARWELMGPEPRRSPLTERGTARSCYRRERYWSDTASWPRNMDIRLTKLWPRRGRMNSATFTNRTESHSRPSPMPAIISSSVPLCWTGATFWKRLSIEVWVRRRMPISIRSSRSGPREASFARSIMPERDRSTPPLPCFAWNVRSSHGCRKAISADE